MGTGIAQAVVPSTIGSTDSYAYSSHQVYSYKLVMPAGGTLRNIHVGLPLGAALAVNSTIDSPNWPTGTARKYGTFYDFFPPKPSLVGLGWTLYFRITGAINPPPSTVNALIEAWNSSGAKYASFRTSGRTYPIAPLPSYPALCSYPVADNLCAPAPYTIANENMLPGSTGWQLTVPADTASPQIEAYSDKSSAYCGQTFGMHVNVTDGAGAFTTEVWRYGWYAGKKGRLVSNLGPRVATRQASRVLTTLERSSDWVTPSLQSPRRATTANNWTTSFYVTIPPNWTPGTYLFKLTDSTGFQTYVPFVIRDDSSTATYEMAMAFMTYQAYSTWGGASLYAGISGQDYDQAVVDSFDRPFGGTGRSSDGRFLYQDAHLVAEFERRGLPTAYIVDQDLGNHAAHLSQHKTLVLGPHTEYWTVGMRSTVDTGVVSGMNILNFGANQAWWQADLAVGRPSGYYQRSLHTSRACAPDHTGYFHDVANGCYGSSQKLFGMQYNCWGAGGDAVAGNNWLWANTGLAPGGKIPHLLGGATGTETDVINIGQPKPPGLTVLAHSPLSLCRNTAAAAAGQYSDMTYYRNSAGGQVFSAGTQNWVCFLDPFCPPSGQTGATMVSKLMDNLLAQFASIQPPPTSTATIAQQYAALPNTTPRALPARPFCRVDQSEQQGCVAPEADGD